MSDPSQNSTTFVTSFGAPDEVHPVLIAGAGPAGTLLALCLARLGVRPLIVDSNHFIDHEWGRGDALFCRTIEVLRSLGLRETMIASGKWIPERAYWVSSIVLASVIFSGLKQVQDMNANPPACKTLRVFSCRVRDFLASFIKQHPMRPLTVPRLSRPLGVVKPVPALDIPLAIRQGLVEKILTDATTVTCGATVLRPWSVVDVRLDEKDPENNPVIATLKSQYGETREVRARYAVGCDGGRSNVRQAMHKYGVKLEGNAHDSMWSAMDVVGFQTDFPDTQKLSIVASAHGTIMIIPREDINGKNCMRFYCEVDPGRTPSLKDVVATVHNVFHPYKFSWDEINWFTIYTVAQRIASSFHVKERIFLAGDAAQIHSPKGGLGMNTALMDTHNLAVKIALVETGVAKPAILSTYALERRQVATHLVQMDAKLIEIYAAHGKSEDLADIAKLIAFHAEHYAFQAGTNITYAPNCMVDNTVSHAPSAMAKLVGGEGLIVGRRLLPASVKRFLDGLNCEVLDVAPCDGRFTIFICLGDLIARGKVGQLESLRDFVYRLDGLWAQLAKTHSASGAASVLRLIAVTTTSHLSIEAAALLHSGSLGISSASTAKLLLFDTSSLYSDDVPCLSPYAKHTALTATTKADALSIKAAAGILLHPLHQKWDIDMEIGGLVVVRPDGHVGTLTRGVNAAAWMKVERYFEGFLVL
ncbi:FAD binding domain-containing protein [Mycena capillaripes]|nr:FAD binding domain-containing protein [Mycena capillaripes]